MRGLADATRTVKFAAISVAIAIIGVSLPSVILAPAASAAAGPVDFEMQWTVPANGTAMTFPTVSVGTYSADSTIDWGDGGPATPIVKANGNSHTYATAGTYTVKATGTTIKGFSFDTATAITKNQPINITKWGNIQIGPSLNAASIPFKGLANFSISATDAPNLDFIRTSPLQMQSLFNGVNIGTADLSAWDTSGISNMAFLFANSNFNGDISTWDTSSVTNMASMFSNASAFNTSIGNWDTSNVTNMSVMFGNAVSFNSPIGNWDVSKVTTFSGMFGEATSFNQPLDGWGATMGSDPSVTSINLVGMFGAANSNAKGATRFNQPLSSWGPAISKATSLNRMFYKAASFNQNISSWDVSNVTDISLMFSGAKAFNSSLNAWDTSNVTNMSSLFANTTSTDYSTFNSALDQWDVSNVTNFTSMFSGAKTFNQNISGWQIDSNPADSVTMTSMFNGATLFNQNISAWDMSRVTSIVNMFQNAQSFNQPIGAWDTASLASMGGAFAVAKKFNQSLGGWNVSAISGAQAAVFTSTSMSPANLDSTLEGWGSQTLIPGVTLAIAAGSKGPFYTEGAGSVGFDNMTAQGWTVTGGVEISTSLSNVTTTVDVMIPGGTQQVKLRVAKMDGSTQTVNTKSGIAFSSTIGTFGAVTGPVSGVYTASLSIPADNSLVGQQATITASINGVPVQQEPVIDIVDAATAPRNLTVTSTTATAVTLDWDVPSSDGGSPITGYRLYYIKPDGTRSTPVTTTAATTVKSMTALTGGTTYTFVVAATTVASTTGNIPATIEASTPAAAPGIPANFAIDTSVDQASGTQLGVMWDAPSDNGSPITGYVISPMPVGASYTVDVDNSTAVISGLSPDVSYTGATAFKIQAVNAIGTGAKSTTSVARGIVATPPTAPINPHLVSTTPTSVTIEWGVPASSGSSAIVDYTVSGGPSNIVTTATTATITGMPTGVGFVFTVYARNSQGDGDSASTPPISTLPSGPDQVDSFTFSSVTKTTAVLAWGMPSPSEGSDPMDGYVLTGSNLTNPSDAPIVTTPTLAQTQTVSGLLPGDTYEFSVAGYNNAGPGIYRTVTLTTLPDVPASVQNIAVSDNTGTSATIDWDAPLRDNGSVITEYRISGDINAVVTAPATSYIATNLTPNTFYAFTISAVNAEGVGPVTSSAFTASATESSPVRSLIVGTPTSSTLTASWLAPATDNGSPITGYEVTVNGATTAIPSTQTSFTATGLDAATNYSFSVVAINAVGASTAVAASGVTSITVPGAPTGVGTSAITQTSALVSWTAPAYVGGSPVTGYTVTAVNGATTITVAAAAGDTSATLGFLTAGKTYAVTVVANNAAGSSLPGTASATTLPSAPEQVTNVTVSNTVSSVTLNWAAPNYDGGSPVTAYLVKVDGVLVDTLAPSVFTYTVLNTTPGVSITVTVAAQNAVGDSTGYDVTLTPVSTEPDAPTGVVASVVNATEASVTWVTPWNNGSPLLAYTITATPLTGPTVAVSAPAAATTASINGLTPGMQYAITVVANNALGASPTTGTDTVTMPAVAPNAPAAVSASVSGTTATITWAAPTFDGGSPLTGYEVFDSGVSVGVVSSLTLTMNAPALAPGSVHSFSVKAINVVGSSLAATAASVTVPAVAPTVVQNVTATSTQTAITVSWNAPAYDGGAVITGYEVTFQGVTTTLAANVSSFATPNMLTRGTGYSFTIVAVNAATLSSPSVTNTFSTAVGAPDAVTNLREVSKTSTSVTVGWDAPAFDGGASVTGYVVNSGDPSITVNNAARTATWTGLNPAQTVTFVVAATNSVGNGASVNLSATTNTSAPTAAPANFAAFGVTNDTVNLDWDSVVYPQSGGLAVDYVVTITPNDGSIIVDNNGTSATISGLSPVTTYTAQVVARNTDGTGPSAAVGFTTLSDPTTAVQNLAANNVTYTSFDVSWTAPSSDGGSAVTGYLVELQDANSTTMRLDTVSSSTLTYSFTGLAAGASYSAIVTPVSASSVPNPAATVTVSTPAYTAPGLVQNLQAGDPSSESVTVTWSAPLADGGTLITGYDVYLDSSLVGTVPGNMFSYTFAGLNPQGNYSIAIAAVNAAGVGAQATTSVTMDQAPTGPGVVVGLTQSGSSTDSVTVSWSAPVSDGGSPITGYEVIVDGGAPVAVSGTSFTVSTTVQVAVTVYAVNAVGNGTSDSINATPGATPEPTPTPTPAPLPAPVNYSVVARDGSCPEFFTLGGWEAWANAPVCNFTANYNPATGGYSPNPEAAVAAMAAWQAAAATPVEPVVPVVPDGGSVPVPEPVPAPEPIRVVLRQDTNGRWVIIGGERFGMTGGTIVTTVVVPVQATKAQVDAASREARSLGTFIGTTPALKWRGKPRILAFYVPFSSGA